MFNLALEESDMLPHIHNESHISLRISQPERRLRFVGVLEATTRALDVVP
jgi:hypothetical protein